MVDSDSLFNIRIFHLLYKMQISIKFESEEPLILDVKPNDTIESVKQTISKIKNVTPGDLNLVYSGNILNDELKLEDYEVAPRSEFHGIIKKMSIYGSVVIDGMQIVILHSENKRFLLNVRKTDKIGKMKTKISEKTELPTSQMLLFHGTSCLMNDDLTLKDAGIEDRTAVVVSVSTNSSADFANPNP